VFKPEDFQIPLEKQLKLRLVIDEVDQCSDVETLRVNLKACAESLLKYQHLLGKVLEQQLINDLENWNEDISKIIKEANNQADA
jgi:hypothetical protein